MMTRLLLLAAALLPSALAQADGNAWSTLQRGLYLVRAGDCAACHTIDEDEPFAGDRALPTPFGTIYSSNLTPDEATGIGSWTAGEFFRAMHEGRSADGHRLYPAFPYTSYTVVTREDSDAMFAYLGTLEPVRRPTREPEFPFPLNIRPLLAGWNLLNFDARRFEPDPERSASWNRGKYLVEGLGHCGLCHSPKTLIGAEKTGAERYTGGLAEGWWAPSLTRDARDGIGAWTRDDLVEYLAHGRNRHSAAFGAMAEVIHESTRHLTESDLYAIADYFDALPGADERAENPTGEEPDESSGGLLVALGLGDEPADLATGELIYATQCSACHGPEGEGVPYLFGAVAGSALTQASDPTTLIRLILEGVRSVPTERFPTPHAMPPYGWKLGDAEVAAVSSYVRNAFGNRASTVSAKEVEAVREAH